ncbi:hypothetical protein JR063_12095 [Xanthomonas sp. CFBP 8700]|nr:hypothetical protein [Xanthomonas bonasiae]
MKRSLFWCAGFCLVPLSGAAEAFQVITGRVVEIEATYMPSRIPFTLSEGNATCPAGHALLWANNTQENTKAIYATLMSALVSGKQIKVFLEDNDTSCTGKFIYLVN